MNGDRVRRWFLKGLAAASVAAVVLTSCGPSFDDPDDARCDAPSVTVGAEVASLDHREVEIRFGCMGAEQVGTLYVPSDSERHPAVIWVHAAGEASRLPFQAPIVSGLVDEGIAFFAFDKRGVGESEGECCPGDYGHFNLLTADVIGAIEAVRSTDEIDPDRVGLIGASQAGWIAPRAAADSHHVAFMALAAPGILPYEEVKAYAELTGGDGSPDPFPSDARITETLSGASHEGMESRPFLQRMGIPALWLIGGRDREVPFRQTMDLLERLTTNGADFTVVPFEAAGHGLLDVPPTDPDALPTLISWVVDVAGPNS
jgi:alpha-beta hydrolase superfamily lysophospholipase